MIFSGVVWLGARHLFDELTAQRLGSILIAALLTGLVYLVVAPTYGTAAGLFAAVALLTLPRFFFHAHLAALDVPVAFGCFALTFLVWKTVDSEGWAWGLAWGVVWGLAVGTKLNAILVPIALIGWFALCRRRPCLVPRVLIMGVTAAVTFFLTWPWLYYDTQARVIAFANWFLHHFVVGQWYFGKWYATPPWHAVLVMLWAVMPSSVTALIGLGLLRTLRGHSDGGLAWLLILSFVVSILPFISGMVPLYDNERLFMPAFPFLAALAGIGFGAVAKYLVKHSPAAWHSFARTALPTILATLLLAPQSLSMVRLFPHLLSYYSEGVGGLPGATRLGLETTYWCETFGAALPYINAHAQTGDVVWSDETYVLWYYQRLGKLRDDLVLIDKATETEWPDLPGFDRADWYIFQYRQTSYGPAGDAYPYLRALERLRPVYELTFQGIPLMRLYNRAP